VILLPCPLEKHEAGDESSSNVTVEVLVVAITQGHVFQDIDEIVVDLVHDHGTRIAILVKQVQLVVANHLIVIGNIPENAHQPGILIAPEEAGYGTPVLVGIVRQIFVFHVLNPLYEKIGFAHPGEIPGRTGIGSQPCRRFTGGIPRSGSLGFKAPLLSRRGEIISEIVTAQRGVIHPPARIITYEIVLVETVGEQPKVILTRPVVTVVHSGQ